MGRIIINFLIQLQEHLNLFQNKHLSLLNMGMWKAFKGACGTATAKTKLRTRILKYKTAIGNNESAIKKLRRKFGEEVWEDVENFDKTKIVKKFREIEAKIEPLEEDNLRRKRKIELMKEEMSRLDD